MTKIFLIECSSPAWIQVAESLISRNIQVVYWTAWNKMQATIEQQFDSLIFHDTFYAKAALDPQGKPCQLEKFDSICSKIWQEEAQLVYDMLSRFDHSRDLSFIERSVLFNHYLTYWRHVLNIHQPHMVIFSSPPHVVYDYVLLTLCRALKIKTLMFEEATIYPPYCLAMHDYLGGSEQLRLASQKTYSVSTTSHDIVRKLSGDYASAKPTREIIAAQEMEIAIREGIKGLKEKEKAIKKRDRKYKGNYLNNEKIVNTGSLYKEKNVSLQTSYSEPFANSRYITQVIEEYHKTNELRAFYNQHVRPLESITQPFIYIPLAGQPERTSNPQAGIFANQILLINFIASFLPTDWQIVIREHPNQFHPNFAVNMYRTIEYYESILSLKNVVFVSNTADPFTIIDRAEVIATSGGTTALEAVARGKPALLLGYAWYRDCPGVFHIQTEEDIKSFFETLGSIVVSKEAFANYIESISHGCFRGLGDYPPADYPISEEENARNLSALIVEEIRNRSDVDSQDKKRDHVEKCY